MVPPTASPKRIARSTAPRFATGSVPGSAMSTAEACVFGAAPKAVGAPENIFERVESCAWVSRPMTISQSTGLPLSASERGGRAPMPVGRALILVRYVEHPRFAEIAADQLQPNRLPVRAEAAGDRHRRESCEVRRNRIDVAEVHLYRVGDLFADPERHRRRG